MRCSVILLIVGGVVCSVDGSVRLNGGIVATGNRRSQPSAARVSDVAEQDVNVQGSYLRALDTQEDQLPSGLFQNDGLTGNLREQVGSLIDQGAAVLTGAGANTGLVSGGSGGLANQIGALVDQGAALLTMVSDGGRSNAASQGIAGGLRDQIGPLLDRGSNLLTGASANGGVLNIGGNSKGNQGGLIDTAAQLLQIPGNALNTGGLLSGASSGVLVGSEATQGGLLGNVGNVVGNMGNVVGNVLDSAHAVPVLGNVIDRVETVAGNARSVLVGG